LLNPINGTVFALTTTTAANSMAATFQVSSSFGDYQLVFGDVNTNSFSAFIDDAHFAARETPDRANPGFVLSATGGDGFVGFVPMTDATRLYLISGTPDMIAPLLQAAGATACTCAFMRWGFWGADFTNSNPNDSPARERVHLGQWVAGSV